MRILGLDVGEKTIGVAVSDLLGITAQGVEVIRRVSYAKDFDRLSQLIKEYEVERIIVGMPRRTDGSYGPEAEKIQAFTQKMQKTTDLPVEFWDERFTTKAAQRMLIEGDVSRRKRRQVVDKVAASIILQGYLDARQA